MKRALIIAVLVFASPASAHILELSDQEIEAQAQLNHQACQAVGLTDGGKVCQTGAFLNQKLLDAKKPKPAEPKRESP